ETASLLSGACEVGALRGAPAHRDALARFGRALGMAFQITDDLLDYTQPQAVTGKPSGLDLKEHKVTLPLIAALERMDAAGRRYGVFLHLRDADLRTGARGSAGGVDHARPDRDRRLAARRRGSGDRLLRGPVALLARQPCSPICRSATS